MSYSYIKTVFPDFNKTSNKIYDDSLYDINFIEKKDNIKENDVKQQDVISKNKEFQIPINNLL